jgi:hypothetical protein
LRPACRTDAIRGTIGAATGINVRGAIDLHALIRTR